MFLNHRIITGEVDYKKNKKVVSSDKPEWALTLELRSVLSRHKISISAGAALGLKMAKFQSILSCCSKEQKNLCQSEILTICSPDRHDSVDFLTREEIQEVSRRSRVKLLFSKLFCNENRIRKQVTDFGGKLAEYSPPPFADQRIFDPVQNISFKLQLYGISFCPSPNNFNLQTSIIWDLLVPFSLKSQFINFNYLGSVCALLLKISIYKLQLFGICLYPSP